MIVLEFKLTHLGVGEISYRINHKLSYQDEKCGTTNESKSFSASGVVICDDIHYQFSSFVLPK